MLFIDLLAEQRNLRLTEEGLAIAEAAVPATQKTVSLAKPLTAGLKSCLAERAGIKDF